MPKAKRRIRRNNAKPAKQNAAAQKVSPSAPITIKHKRATLGTKHLRWIFTHRAPQKEN